MFDEKFWLAVSFIGFITLIIKYVIPPIKLSLDAKSRQIAEEILAAKEMKEKAALLLEKAEIYCQESYQHAEKLIRDAEIESQKLIESSILALELEVKKKTDSALERIRNEELATIRQVKTQIVNYAVENLNKTLSQNMSDEKHIYLMNQATQDLEKITH